MPYDEDSRTRGSALTHLSNTVIQMGKAMQELSGRVSSLEAIERKFNIPQIAILTGIFLTLLYIAWILHLIATHVP